MAKKRRNNTKKFVLKATLALVFLAVLATGIYYVSRTKPVMVVGGAPNTAVTPATTDSDQAQRFSQKKIAGELNGDLLKFRSDKLGIEFQVPNVKEFLVLTENFENKSTDSKLKNVTQNYCLSTDSNNSGLCISLFAISSFTKGTSPKRGFEFSDLTSFSETTFQVYETFSDGTSSEVNITNAKYLKNKNGISILRVLGESEYSKMQQQSISVFGHPEEGYIGAIVNLPNNPEYSGFNISMKLSDTLTEKVFDQILDSIKIVK